MRNVLAYAEFEVLWERFAPETPGGRDAKGAMAFHTDAPSLEHLWDQTEAALALLGDLDELRTSRVLHHLKRIPRIPEAPGAVLDEAEIFQVKKFLHNLRCLVELLEPEQRRFFGLAFELEALARLLDVGRQSAESFYIADAYDPDLLRVRELLREIEASLTTVRDLRHQDIQARWGIAFEGRDFALVGRHLLGDPTTAAPLLLVEPYDEQHWAVRPMRCAEELALLEQRDLLLQEERLLEAAVIGRISEAIRKDLSTLLASREALTAFDLALARARLARQLDLVRPRLGSRVRVEGGRFLPCEALCRELQLPYVPLDLHLEAPATVIFGSNMGGKTVVLKTLAFLQLAAQMGLFVPAKRFETGVFPCIHYIGEGCLREDAVGLSGFGFEIRQLCEAWREAAGGALLLFDEFARTTSSREAEALLTALLAALSEKPVVALFSTHFHGVGRLPGVRYLRMGGLDRQGLEDLVLEEGTPSPSSPALLSRIALINRRMAYHLVEDTGASAPSDALAVAELLGLDPGIARRAKALLASPSDPIAPTSNQMPEDP